MTTTEAALFAANLTIYNAEVVRARNAYAADMAVEAGFCANRCGRRHETERRLCQACRRSNRWETTGRAR